MVVSFVVDSSALVPVAADLKHFILAGGASEVCRRIVELGSERVIFFSEGSSPKHLKLALDVKKRLPGLNVVFAGPDLLEGSVKALKSSWLEAVVRCPTAMEAALQAHTRGAALPEALTLWRSKNGVVHWNKPPEATATGSKVLLVIMPAWNNDFAPSGLAHIAGALKSAGHRVEVLDLNREFWDQLGKKFRDLTQYHSFLLWTNQSRYQTEIFPLLDPVFKRLDEVLANGQFAHVGFSLFETNLKASRDAFARVRSVLPEARIFCGGPSCEVEFPFRGRDALEQNEVDGLVLGEGEVSAIELLASWDAGGDGAVPGVCVRTKPGEILYGKSRPLANLSALPPPDFSLFPIYNYDTLELPAFFSRGCVARCTFCAETQFWVRFRILPAERVLDAMHSMTAAFGIRTFRFTDSLLNGSHRHLEKFADLVAETGTQVQFNGYCRLDGDLSDELLRKLSRAGCTSIAFGMESASQKVTDLMRKEVDVTQYSRIIKGASRAGIEVICCMIVGFPGETWRDFLKTLFKLAELRPYIHTLNLSVLSLAQISKSAEDMEQLGVGPKSLEVDEWTTRDGRNTPFIRMVRFWILHSLWRWSTRRALVPSWLYRPA